MMWPRARLIHIEHVKLDAHADDELKLGQPLRVACHLGTQRHGAHVEVVEEGLVKLERLNAIERLNALEILLPVVAQRVDHGDRVTQQSDGDEDVNGRPDARRKKKT